MKSYNIDNTLASCNAFYSIFLTVGLFFIKVNVCIDTYTFKTWQMNVSTVIAPRNSNSKAFCQMSE